MNNIIFTTILELLFNNQLDLSTKFMVAKDAIFICDKIASMDPSKIDISFDRVKMDFVAEVSKKIVDGKDENFAAQSLYILDKYQIYESIIKAIQSEVYEEDKLKDLIKVVESMKQFIFIDSNIETFADLIFEWKEGRFKSPEQAVARFHNDIESIYTSSLKIQESLQINSNFLSLYHIKDKQEMFMAHLNRFCKKENILPSNFYNLDRLLGDGFERNRLYTIAGTPGSGKSAAMLNIGKNFCENIITEKTQDKKFILYITLENTWEETVIRLAANTLKQPFYNIKKLFAEKQFSTFTKTFFETLSTYPMNISFFEPYSVTTMDIIGHINAIINKEKRQPAAIIIDYLDLMGTHEKLEYRHQLGKIASGFKNMSTRFACPVITGTQLIKSSYEKEQHDISDIGESSQKIDFSDVVILLKNRGDGQVGFTVGKNRCGPLGTFSLKFNGSCYRFENLINNNQKSMSESENGGWELSNIEDSKVIDVDTNTVYEI